MMVRLTAKSVKTGRSCGTYTRREDPGKSQLLEMPEMLGGGNENGNGIDGAVSEGCRAVIHRYQWPRVGCGLGY